MMTTTVLCLLFLCLTLALFANAEDLDPIKFHENVIDDGQVWLVEFYSAMCGSCKEFAPTWEKISSHMESLKIGKINIDTKQGMELAKNLKILDEGLPNIRLFSGTRPQGVSIFTGDDDGNTKAKMIVRKIKENISSLSKNDDGFYLKARHT